MTEHPLLCRDDVVRAILAGTQTQDRRPVKNWTQPGCAPDCSGPDGYDTVQGDRIVRVPWDAQSIMRLAPWRVGDELWVREALRRLPPDHRWVAAGYVEGVYAADGKPLRIVSLGGGMETWAAFPHKGNVCPSIHMPRWASRITLTITDVRAQRVQSISEADCIAEGAVTSRLYSDAFRAQHGYSEPVCAFHELWDSIYAKKGYGWDTNPWVWATTFRRT